MRSEFEIYTDDWIKNIGPIELMQFAFEQLQEELELINQQVKIKVSRSGIIKIYYIDIEGVEIGREKLISMMQIIYSKLIKLKSFI